MTTTTERRQTIFGGLTIDYDDTVLEPRAWTVLQSDWAVELAGSAPKGPMLELCCGAGHIGLEVIRRSTRDLLQVDVCESACGFARHNAASAGLADRVEIRCIDLAELTASTERYPVVLADPPYLPTDEVSTFPADPLRAIDGGPDGLALLRRCVEVIDVVLHEHGVALVQVAGAAQASEVAPLLPDALCIDEVREHDPRRAVLSLVRRERSSIHHSHRGGRR